MSLKAKIKKATFSMRKKFSPTIRQSQIDVVTKLTTGRVVLELAEEAKDVATTKLVVAETDLDKKADKLDKAKVEHESAVITKNLRRKDFDTVADLLK